MTLSHVLTILLFCTSFNLFATDKIRWWDCIFSRPEITLQLNSGEKSKLSPISVAFALENPLDATDELGDPKQYRPTFKGGALNLTAAPDKLSLSVQEDIMGPSSWPASMHPKPEQWTSKSPIEFSFERDITKGMARYQLKCVPRN